MSAFYSLSDDEDGPVAGPSSPSMLATPRRNKPNDSSAAAYALESPSASPFSRGGGHAGPSTSAGAITPPRRPPAYNRGLSPSLSIRGAAPTAPGPGPPPPLPAITRLQKAWVAERSCPELLPWSDPNGSLRCDEVVDEVCAQVEQQVVSHHDAVYGSETGRQQAKADIQSPPLCRSLVRSPSSPSSQQMRPPQKRSTCGSVSSN